MARQLTGKSYVGQQYRGGRKEGVKNLKKTERGTLVNQHGVEFTPEEKRALENAANAVNRKRKKMLKEAATLPRMVGGRDTGDTVGSLQMMGKESDFILARRSKSLQRFRTRKEFEWFMNSARSALSPSYIDDRTRLYKRNYQQALINAYGEKSTKDIRMKIRMMKPEDFRKLVESDELAEIGYIYDDTEIEGKLNTIRATLGMKLKEEPHMILGEE